MDGVEVYYVFATVGNGIVKVIADSEGSIENDFSGFFIQFFITEDMKRIFVIMYFLS